MGKYSKWLNVKCIRYPNLEKPCKKLDYCPYGQLVEEFPLWHAPDYPHPEYGDKLACDEKHGAIITFGHDCPVHYHAELVGGPFELSNEELEELVLDLRGRHTLTTKEVELLQEAEEVYSRRKNGRKAYSDHS